MKLQYMTALLAVSVTVASLGSGCSREDAREEVRRYNMQAYEEGSRDARTEGPAMDSGLLDRLKDTFARENLRLTNEGRTENNEGDRVYSYRILDDASYEILLYVFHDEKSRIMVMNDLYGTERSADGKRNSHVVAAAGSNAVVYVSAGDQKDPYAAKVKKAAAEVLAGWNPGAR